MEARLSLALAAAEGAKVVWTDTKPAHLYGDMGHGALYIRPPNCWPEPIPEGHGFYTLESIYGTRRTLKSKRQQDGNIPGHGCGAERQISLVFIHNLGVPNTDIDRFPSLDFPLNFA
jgi:hypothetical protein